VVSQRCGLLSCADVDRLKDQIPGEANVILDQHGEELGKLFLERRVLVELEDCRTMCPARSWRWRTGASGPSRRGLAAGVRRRMEER
jgi:hypothetical protein